MVTGQLWYGCTPLEYLHQIGFMKPNTQFIHGIWLKPNEIDILAKTGVSVQHNPGSNLKVGSGLAPIRALLDAGVNVSMGTDGCGSIEGTDMQNALYLCGLLHKLRGDHTKWVGATEALHAATVGGARALGRGRDLGAIEAGRTADLTAYRLDSIPFTPLNNAVSQLVFSAAYCASLVTSPSKAAFIWSTIGRVRGPGAVGRWQNCCCSARVMSMQVVTR